MNTFFRIIAFWMLVSSAHALVVTGREETVSLFQNRKVSVVVPSGFEYATHISDEGLPTVQIADPAGKLSLTIRFLPATDELYASARSRREFMDEAFRQYVGSSVEKAMRFEELDPKTGAGTYSAFTDASLVGKSSFPPNEYLHVTAGIKAWPGVVAVFSLFSNSIASREYQALMTMLRESVQEKPVPFR